MVREAAKERAATSARTTEILRERIEQREAAERQADNEAIQRGWNSVRPLTS